MIWRILGILAGAVSIAVIAMTLTSPADLHVERSVLIEAKPEEIFARINDFHRWEEWSPFEKKDPLVQRLYGRIPSGKGATYGWIGHGSVGSGHMEILESTPPEKIRIKLDLVEPFEAHNLAEFTIAQEANGTRVTWSMTGPMSVFARFLGIFVSADSMIGPQFEAGLGTLKAIAESADAHAAGM